MAFRLFSVLFFFSIISSASAVINKVFYEYDLTPITTPKPSMILTIPPPSPQSSPLEPTSPLSPITPTRPRETFPIPKAPLPSPRTSPWTPQKTVDPVLTSDLMKAWKSWLKDFITNNTLTPTIQTPSGQETPTDGWPINTTMSIAVTRNEFVINEGRKTVVNKTELDNIRATPLTASINWTIYLGAAGTGLAVVSLIYTVKRLSRSYLRRQQYIAPPSPPPSREELGMATLSQVPLSTASFTLPSRRTRLAGVMETPYNDLTLSPRGNLRRHNTLPRSFVTRAVRRENIDLQPIGEEEEEGETEVTTMMRIEENNDARIDISERDTEALEINITDAVVIEDGDNVSWGTDWGDEEGVEEIYLTPVNSSPVYESIE